MKTHPLVLKEKFVRFCCTKSMLRRILELRGDHQNVRKNLVFAVESQHFRLLVEGI